LSVSAIETKLEAPKKERIKKSEITTIAILMRLFAINMVASKRRGFCLNERIFEDALSSSDFRFSKS